MVKALVLTNVVKALAAHVGEPDPAYIKAAAKDYSSCVGESQEFDSLERYIYKCKQHTMPASLLTEYQ